MGHQRGEDVQKHTSRSETKVAILSWHRIIRLQTDETFTARKEETFAALAHGQSGRSKTAFPPHTRRCGNNGKQFTVSNRTQPDRATKQAADFQNQQVRGCLLNPRGTPHGDGWPEDRVDNSRKAARSVNACVRWRAQKLRFEVKRI